jgi:hypothetical protein
LERRLALCYVAAIPYILAAVSAASAASSVVQQNKQVQATLNGTATAQQADYNAIAAQQGEIDDGATAASLAVQAEANRARATLRVAQGESGLVGPTQLRELAAQKRAEESNLATIEANRASADANLAQKKVGIDIRAKGRMDAANQQVIGKFAAGLQIGGAAVSGYMSGRGLTSPGAKKIDTSSSYVTEN